MLARIVMSTATALGIMVTVFLAAFGYLAVELRSLRAELKGDIDQSRQELAGVRSEMRGNLSELRAEMGAKFDILTERYIDHLRHHAG
jgi:peroxiredoxin family protein